jgi:hypothetical protein
MQTRTQTQSQAHSADFITKPEEVITSEKSAVVALYNTHTEAEAAVRELQKSGFDMRKLSIVGKDYQTEQDVVGYYNNGDRMQAWGKTGAFWGGIWGLLFGSAFFLVPGIGSLLVAGPLVGWIIGGLEGAVVVGGLSALGAGLFSLGIPKDSIIQYETQVKAGKYLLFVHDSSIEARRARGALAITQHQGVTKHACCA